MLFTTVLREHHEHVLFIFAQFLEKKTIDTFLFKNTAQMLSFDRKYLL